MTTKLRVRLGVFELEYEGDSEFTKDALEQLIQHIGDVVGTTMLTDVGADIPETETIPENGKSSDGFVPKVSLHTNSIASKLAVKSASDLTVAAAARLQLFADKATINRHELLSEMKSATSHFKASMVKNLSSTLKGLVASGKFNQITQNSYSLSSATRSEIESRLA